MTEPNSGPGRLEQKLTPAQIQRLEAESRQSPAAKALRLIRGNPRLLPHAARTALHGATGALLDDPTLGWLASTNEIRKVAPDAVLGAEWGGLDTFMALLRRVATDRDDALEIGCGGGRVTAHIRPLVGSLDACDVSPAVLDEARAHTKDLVIDFFTVEGFGDNLQTGRYDLVASHDVFVHFEFDQVARYVANVGRALKPGGHFVVSVYTIDDETEWGQYRDAIGQPGPLKARRVRRFPSGIYDRLFAAFGFEVIDQARTPLEEYSGKPFGHLNYLVKLAHHQQALGPKGDASSNGERPR